MSVSRSPLGISLADAYGTLLMAQAGLLLGRMCRRSVIAYLPTHQRDLLFGPIALTGLLTAYAVWSDLDSARRQTGR